MKIRRQKKGFTIVELVIVIAVIAILSAILIPTFAGLVKKSKVAVDTALVKDLNTVLATDKAVNGKHATMHDALEVTKESGLDVSRLNAKVAKNEILWDSANDVFCYLDDGKIKYVPDTELEVKAKDVEAYQYFVIRDVDSADDISTEYSTYLRSCTLTNVPTTKGLDVGLVEGIATISYTNSSEAQNVVIRTNGGKLVVNAPNDTVKHYGEAELVNVDAVADASYDEFGKVNGFITIKDGHFAAFTSYKYLVKIDASVADINNGTVKISLTGNSSNIQVYADADVVSAIQSVAQSSGKPAFSGVNTENILDDSSLISVSTVEELEANITKVNNGELVNPTLFLSAGDYQFTKRLEINKSVSIIGVSNKTNLLGYYNPNQNNVSEAFHVNTTAETQTVSFENLNFKNFAIYKSEGVLVGSDKASCSGISANVNSAESTNINVKGCNFSGLNHSFLNLKTGIHLIENCVFDGTIQSYAYPNQIQVGDPNGNKKTSTTIKNCQFISASRLGETVFDSTAISPWGLTTLVVTDCNFKDCSTGISGGSEWFDYGFEYPKLQYSNCTFTNCVMDVQMQYWVESEDEILSMFDSYVLDNGATEPGNYYVDGSRDSKYNVKNYRRFYTYLGNDSYSCIYYFWFKN